MFLISMCSYIEVLSEGVWENFEIVLNFLKVMLEEIDWMICMINDLLNLFWMDFGNIYF